MLYLKNFLLFLSISFFFLDFDFSSQSFSFVPQAEAIIRSPCTEYPDPKSTTDKQTLQGIIEKLQKHQNDYNSPENTDPDQDNKLRDCDRKITAYYEALNKLQETLQCGGKEINQGDIAEMSSVSDLESKINLMTRQRDDLPEQDRPIIFSDGTPGTTRGKDPEKLSDCDTVITLLTRTKNSLEKCNTAIEDLETKKADFTKACTEFSPSGRMHCPAALVACKVCPDTEDFEDYDCMKIHNKTACPELSGEELKRAKEQREEFQEDVEKLQEDIAELEEDIASEEGDLNERLSKLEKRFMEIVRDLERDVVEEKAKLEGQLKTANSEVKKELAEALAAAQAEIDNSLQIAFSFENAITKANMEYRAARRKIYLECEAQANGRVADYKKRRGAAIQTGSLRISLANFLSGGRMSFAQTEDALFEQYNSDCIDRREADLVMAGTEYRNNLRMIEQEKEKYMQKLERDRRNMVSLHQQASQAENQFVQEYAAGMFKLLENHQKAYNSEHQQYLRSKRQLLSETNQIAVLHKHLGEKKHSFRNKGIQLVQEEGLASYLRSEGVTDDEDKENEFSKAVDSFVNFSVAINKAEGDCEGRDEEIAGVEKEREYLTQDASEEGLEAFGITDGHR